MSLNLVTGHLGEGHISSADAAQFNKGVFGDSAYRLGSNAFSMTRSGMHVTIGPGDIVAYGRHITLAQDEEYEFDLDQGTSSGNRVDLLVIRYVNDESQGTEYAEFAVLSGENAAAGATPVLPSYTGLSITNETTICEVPLWSFNIKNMAVEFETDRRPPNEGTISSLTAEIKSLLNRVISLQSYASLLDAEMHDGTGIDDGVLGFAKLSPAAVVTIRSTSVRHDTNAQGLGEAAKANARGNIDAASAAQVAGVNSDLQNYKSQVATGQAINEGAISYAKLSQDCKNKLEGGAVKYNAAQSLSSSEKAQARSNIGAQDDNGAVERSSGSYSASLTDGGVSASRENSGMTALVYNGVMSIDANNSKGSSLTPDGLDITGGGDITVDEVSIVPKVTTANGGTCIQIGPHKFQRGIATLSKKPSGSQGAHTHEATITFPVGFSHADNYSLTSTIHGAPIEVGFLSKGKTSVKLTATSANEDDKIINWIAIGT